MSWEAIKPNTQVPLPMHLQDFCTLAEGCVFLETSLHMYGEFAILAKHWCLAAVLKQSRPHVPVSLVITYPPWLLTCWACRTSSWLARTFPTKCTICCPWRMNSLQNKPLPKSNNYVKCNIPKKVYPSTYHFGNTGLTYGHVMHSRKRIPTPQVRLLNKKSCS